MLGCKFVLLCSHGMAVKLGLYYVFKKRCYAPFFLSGRHQSEIEALFFQALRQKRYIVLL